MGLYNINHDLTFTEQTLTVTVTELVTPPLDGMILPGITRDSTLALARDHASGKAILEGLPEPSKFVVNERPITMKEIKKAAEDGSLVEFFGTGTCFIQYPSILFSHFVILYRNCCCHQPCEQDWLSW